MMFERKTNETEIKLYIELKGEGKCQVNTSIPFLDHMISTLCFFSKMNLSLKASGDLTHHIIEDVAISLGSAIDKALRNRERIKRFGYAKVPMDDAVAEVIVDLVRRPYAVLNLNISSPVEGIEPQLFYHFFRTFAFSSQITLHINVAYGDDNHHKIEAAFKALGLALREAWSEEERLLSTKGEL